jgi:serine/threonine-protein kinase
VTTGDAATGIGTPTDADAFDSATWLGRTIDDRYKIEQLLGQGGMGAVFLAEHVKLQKKVALKVILPQFAGNGEVAERFAREAMASAKLEHPHVASALDYGALPEGGAYLVMQLARGPSLRKMLESGRPEKRGWRYACEVGAQIADALSAAHAAGIVHRDLKPENVMLEPREDGSELVKVLDFGIARVLDDAAGAGSVSKLTRVGTIIGTPGYMAPEQALGEPVDARADVYALGVILWEACAGRELWNETEVTALVTKQLTTEPPRLLSIAIDVPPELDALVARMLAREKNDRPERAAEVRDVLKRLAFAVSVERMSLPGGGISGSFPAATTSGAFSAAAVQARPSLLEALPARVSQISAALPPAAKRPPVVLAIAGGALLFGVVVLASIVMMCSGGSAPSTTAVATPVVPLPSLPTSIPGLPLGVEPPADEDGLAPIPESLASDFETVVEGTRSATRQRAAERILAQPESSMPPVVHAVAQLEDERSCEGRRDVVVALGTLGDPRALPMLERLDRNHRGCGFFGRQDCNPCLRDELRTALAQLRAR